MYPQVRVGNPRGGAYNVRIGIFGRGAGVVATAVILGGSQLAAGVAGAAPDTGSAGADSAVAGFSTPGFLQDEPYPVEPMREGIAKATVLKNEASPEHEAAPGQARKLTIASPALRRDVTVDVLLPADNSSPRPVLYMLDGVDAPNDYSKWMINGAPEFFADKNVNVVLINGGQSSMYVNWEQDDPALGWNQWETYIAEELPALIDAELGANGARAIAGNSMGAHGAMMMATRHPALYQAFAGFSGCYSTADVLGVLSTRGTVSFRHGNPDNMFAPGGPAWREHDSITNAEALRGKAVYLSAASGLPGRHEQNPTLENVVAGGGLELGANQCTRAMQARLDGLRIPMTLNYEDAGIHDWPYWTDQLPKMWPTMSAGLGI